MKLFEFIIKPKSAFETELRGDTLFGQLCWEFVSDESLLSETFDATFKKYDSSPFLVVSSAYITASLDGRRAYLFNKPSLPDYCFTGGKDKETKLDRKKTKSKNKFILYDDLLIEKDKLNFIERDEFYSGLGIKNIQGDELCKNVKFSHNSINRETWTPGEGEFAPFVKEGFFYADSVELVIFALIDETQIEKESLNKALTRIGGFGFGANASTGKGRFDVISSRELPLPKCEAATCAYTIAPFVLPEDSSDEVFFTPFIRFGKHGGGLAKGKNPFKNPIRFASEGAVIKPKDTKFFDKPYCGRAIRNISISELNTVAQGYTIYLPCRELC